jgi:uncharacterized membrane protein YcaP (DUF421 family)
MKEDQIKWGDWQRILFGEAPPAYLLEVVVRVAIIYILVLLAMRLLGKRMTAKVSRSELVARVSIAAAVGLPIQRPNRGLLGAAAVVFVIVFVGRLMSSIVYRSNRFEHSYQGYYAILVRDGVLDYQRMKKIRITPERLYAELRSDGVRHLGQVKRMYMEANGDFSIVRSKEEKPGLSVIPEWDTELRERQKQTDLAVCKRCGQEWKIDSDECDLCNEQEKEFAFLLPPVS